jgi:biopolymer transport protein ExbB
VMGMIQTFHVITDFGIGNPSLTAQGISVALLTTQAGLTAAFPAMIFHNYLIGKKNTLVAHMLNDCEQLVNRIAVAAVRAEGEGVHHV